MRFVVICWLAMFSCCCYAAAQSLSVRTTYHVKQVAGPTIYIDGGSADGLAEGMRLVVNRLAAGEAKLNAREIGSLVVFAVASNSAACEFRDSKGAIEQGDLAELSVSDAEAIKISRTAMSKRKYAQVVSFTDGDPIEAELRAYVPKPPLPEVNRIRGRVSFEQNVITDHGAGGLRTMQEGMVLRADMTRIGGSYWNFTGYWRGRMTSRTGSRIQTLNDLLSRTYHIGLYYNNPQSKYTAGFGRFLLPWAASLSTIDGGYFARRFGRHTTTGIFAGSTPDPTAWNYDPNRQLLGVFTSVEAGSFEKLRYTGTVGAAVSRVSWRPERQFLFCENNILFKNKISIYHDLEADQLDKKIAAPGDAGPRIARSFLTVRWQPIKGLALDINHNFFRDVPTFDTRLLGTGLLDKFLFQGVSFGFRIDLPYRTTFYSNFGRNKRQDDPKASLNYMTGVVLNKIPYFPFRTDLRYSKFNSSFGRGRYAAIDLSRQLSEQLRIDVQIGEQTFTSSFTANHRSRFANAYVDYFVGRHYILGGGWTLYRGQVQNYDQTFFNLGYRF